VLKIHREYVEAGAELLRTNTFTANALRMDGARAREAILRGVALAREAAGPDRWVAGSVGPLENLNAGAGEAEKSLREQCRALAESGCDAIVLETFGTEAGLGQAIQAARELGLPLIAQMFRAVPSSAGAQVVGVNCVPAIEVARMLDQAGKLLPLSAFPSAGLPKAYQGPDDFARGASALLARGVRLIGGCCGTTPAYLRALKGLL
jgi:methionine synthase I (cobalamin-dependent)